MLDEWLRTAEIEDTTRRTYVGSIERTVKPAVGTVGIEKLSARTLETFYAELRRCRTRCSGRPFIERHKTDEPHDCVTEKCVSHACKPMTTTLAALLVVLAGCGTIRTTEPPTMNPREVLAARPHLTEAVTRYEQMRSRIKSDIDSAIGPRQWEQYEPQNRRQLRVRLPQRVRRR